MKHVGQFADIKGKEYTVTVTTEATGSDSALSLGASPFTTAMNAEETLYAPAKYSVGHLCIRTSDYLFDLYSHKAQGTKVVLSSADGVEWTGYATPCLYDMGFVQEVEEIQVECVDALSTLKHFKYQAAEKRVRSLIGILKDTVRRAGAYKRIIADINSVIAGTASPLIEALCISEENFFDDKEAGATDDDVAWSYQDVLEEICRFLGLTAMAVGEDVWLVDYDAIKAGLRNYRIYPLEECSMFIPPTPDRHITGDDYAGANARLSLDNVYNKATVSAQWHTFEQLLPDIFDETDMINFTTSDAPTVNCQDKYFRNISMNLSGVTGNTETMIDRGATGRKTEGFYFVASQYFKNPRINCHGSSTASSYGWDAAQTAALGTCVLKKEFVKSLDLDNWDYLFNSNNAEYLKIATSEVSSLSLVKSIQCNMRGSESAPTLYVGKGTDNVGGSAYDKNYKRFVAFDITVDKPGMLFGGDNTFILITGEVILSHNDNDAYNKGSYDYGKHYNSKVYGKWEYIYCQLKWGGLYWNGNDWQTEECDFRLYFDSSTDKKMVECMYKGLPIRNTAHWWDGLSEEGCAIPLPKGKVMEGGVYFKMYAPAQQYDEAMAKDGQHDGRSFWVWLKDFQIKATIGNPDYSEKIDTETVYTNAINAESVTELDEIELRVCTWDGKQPNYNSVVYEDADDVYQYADKTQCAPLTQGEAAWTGHDGGAQLRQEEHIIYRLVNQYSTPSVILTLPLRIGFHPFSRYTDKTMGSKMFVCDSYNVDYRTGVQTVRLIEKK